MEIALVRHRSAAHRAVGARGRLARGWVADLAVWETPAGVDADGVPVLEPGAELPRLLRTMVAGRTVHQVG